MPQNDELFGPVRGGHPNPVALVDLIGGLFDEHIGGLGLLGVDHMDVVVLLHHPHAALHPVGVEHKDQHAGVEPLIIAQDVHQRLPRRIQIGVGQLLQLVPREDQIVPVHQQELPGRGQVGGLRLPLGPHRRREGAALHLAVGALKDGLQIPVLLQRAGVPLRLPAGQMQGGRVLGLGLQGAVQMHMQGYLVPLHVEARTVAAEHRIRGVFHIPLRVVAGGFDDHLRVGAGAVSGGGQAQTPPPPGVGVHLRRVVPQCGGGGGTGEQGGDAVVLRGGQLCAHALQVGHGAAQTVGGQLQTELVPRLQQHALGLHQPLPHRPVGGLTEIPALGVLQVRLAAGQRDAHIGERRAGEHPSVGLLGQMGQDQPLPVAVEQILRAGRAEHKAAAGRARLQNEMHLGVVAQRLVVPHALHGGADGLFVKDAPGAEAHRKAEPPGDEVLQHLKLHRPHELQADAAVALVPADVELGILLLQRAQGLVDAVGVGPLGQQELVGHHRLQHRAAGVELCAQPLPRPGVGETSDRAYRAGQSLLHGGELRAGVHPELVGLLLPVGLVGGGRLGCAGEQILDTQAAAGDLHVGQALAPLAPADLEHRGGEGLAVIGAGREGAQPFQQRVHPVQLQRRAEPAGEHPAGGDGVRHRLSGHGALGQELLHQPLVAQSQLLAALLGGGGEVHTAGGKAGAQLGQQGGAALPRQIHLVYKQEHRHPMTLQQLPQGQGVALHPVGAADDQHRRVQHLQGALHLGGEVHMAGGVQQGEAHARRVQHRLLGEDGDAPGAFLCVGVQKGVAVIHPPQTAGDARLIEQGFG